MAEEVLLMEGCSICDAPEYVEYVIPKKRKRRSKKMARRRRLSGLGADFLPPEVMENLKIGALSAAGAFVSDRVAEKVKTSLLKDVKWSDESEAALTVGVGVLLGGLVYRFFRRADIASALVIGPMVFAGSTLLTKYLSPPVSSQSGIGLIQVEPTQQPLQAGTAEAGEMGVVTTEEMSVPIPDRPIQAIPFAGI